MVKVATFTKLGAAMLLLIPVSCSRREPTLDGVHIGIVGRTLDLLSDDLRPILLGGAITNIEHLRREYSQRFPHRPPLFFAAEFEPVIPRPNEYQLPLRGYFWLREWSTNDPPSTPLFWSYFHLPKDAVSYLTIGGNERVCSSNEFYSLVASLSNRVESARSRL